MSTQKAGAEQHTPGPWRWGGAISDDEYVVMIGTYRSVECRYTGANTREAVANARLIAAAPEILSALYSTVAELCCLAIEDMDPSLCSDGEPCRVCAVTIPARAAIRKATEDA